MTLARPTHRVEPEAATDPFGVPIRPDVRLLASWYVDRRPDDLAAHLRRHGPLPHLAPEELIARVDAAGLRGRGGAGFPTAAKIRAVVRGRGRRGRRRPVVVANGCEGEPASHKDAALLHCAPHLVLDGIALAARATGAGTAYLCVHAGSPAAQALREQAAARRDVVSVRVEEVPARYVASEASALVQYLSGGPALPTSAPHRASERGVGGAPTLVDNVETLAHLALLARHGADWFRVLGTSALPGTLLVTTGGALRRPGVVEVPAGTPVRAVLDLAGGPVEPVQAVLCGGYGGTWASLDVLDVPLAPGPLEAVGATLGVPSLLALPVRACGLTQTAHLLRYLAGESAGQCGPCTFGLPALAEDVTALACSGPEAPAAHARLLRRLELVAGRGACAHPDGAVRLLRSALRVFDRDLRRHLAGRPCPAAAEAPVLPLPRPGRPILPSSRVSR
ncbi:SLBB domain-containing protein [Pseudonocardia sp. RS11V-5]|uniref:NADH-ubiquinone oxidoreductase-F iron-sulfur binding region domain-containing protein n=1 Tax=Pseudonocardia terrae TaxID=2905831 RepID=UPI001E636213|nr:NADH-ubiquinone oxidoreductase-F iron-sulfur binding region domain-containing protein [Pseudonocardia terrae]MCE3554205.1 SLBB domain-containing protein [Pseudonocardia terrae]